MLKFFASAATLWLLSAGAFAQHVLNGTVSDAQTRDPLINATVHVEGTRRYTVTDSNGEFSFQDVGGNVVISVTYVGYRKHKREVPVTGNQTVEILMEPAAIITDEVVVRATRAAGTTPTTHSTISRKELADQNFGQDIPFLLNWTPSVVTTSDAGTGIGYTGIRIRGSDPTRINVTINGIPYNDSESAGTFWVDIPDIASSTESIQVQRGVGTSTQGAGAFGATISLQTNARRDDPYAEVTNALGSFDTRKHTFSFGSGLLSDHFVIDGRVSKVSSDGFIDRAFSDLGSYYFSAGYYTDKTIIKAITFGGKERTYQSWYGVPESRLKNDHEAMLITAMNEGWNEEQTNNLLESDSRTFNPYLYKNQVDDYQQDHYQLHFSHQPGRSITLNTSLHYTPGKGYYEEYKYDDDLADYGLPDIIIGGETITSSDLIRRRWLDNDFYGFTWSVNYDKNKWNAVAGGGWNRYDGNHFGELLWVQAGHVNYEHPYYFNNGDKRDFNVYFKANHQFTDRLNAFVDLQYRRVDYKVNGTDNDLNDVNVSTTFNFFNPKVGATFALTDASQLYASYGIANREPVRDDFLDFQGNNPEHEQLGNLEVGYRATLQRLSLQANYYLMNYKNQLVLTGEVNDVGAFVRTNAGRSYRTGIELQGSYQISRNLTWNANATFSRNRIEEYAEVLEDYGEDFTGYNLVQRVHRDTDIAFSPSVIAGSSLAFRPIPNSEITLLSKYVGDQYLDNTRNAARTIDGYFVNDLRLSYTWKPSFIREVQLSVLLNNLLDEKYESNGFTYGYLAGPTEYRENFYYPQAGRNFMAMLRIGF